MSRPTAVDPVPRRRCSRNRLSISAPGAASSGSMTSSPTPLHRPARPRRAGQESPDVGQPVADAWPGGIEDERAAARAATCGRSTARSRPPSRRSRSRSVVRSAGPESVRPAGSKPSAPRANTSRPHPVGVRLQTPSGAWNASAEPLIDVSRPGAGTARRPGPGQAGPAGTPTRLLTPASDSSGSAGPGRPCRNSASRRPGRGPPPSSWSGPRPACGVSPRCTTRLACAYGHGLCDLPQH